LNGLRTGRANTALLDPIVVEVYGSHMPLNAGHGGRARTAHADRHRVGQVPAVTRWKRRSVRRVWAEPDHRRQHAAPADPRPDRGTPQGTGQAGQQICRRRAHPQRAPRRHGSAEADENKKLISEDERKRAETEVQKLTDERSRP
jgi:ribosome recycling factor